MSKKKLIAVLLIIGGLLVIGHQWLDKGILIEWHDIDNHETLAFVLLAFGLGGLLFN